MALTRQLIEITFGNAMTQARQLDQCAEDMLRVANNNMGNIKGDISAAWQGESANAYIQKMDLTAGNIVKTAQRLQEIAQTLRTVANIFRNTELRAIELAEQRTY